MLLKQTHSLDDHTPDLITLALIKAQHLFQLELAHYVFPPSVPSVSTLISWARKEEEGSYLSNSAIMCAVVQRFYCILTRSSF